MEGEAWKWVSSWPSPPRISMDPAEIPCFRNLFSSEWVLLLPSLKSIRLSLCCWVVGAVIVVAGCPDEEAVSSFFDRDEGCGGISN